MRVMYKGNLWDTDYPAVFYEGLKDKELQDLISTKYFQQDKQKLLSLTKEELAFRLAVMSAKYQSVISQATHDAFTRDTNSPNEVISYLKDREDSIHAQGYEEGLEDGYSYYDE